MSLEAGRTALEEGTWELGGLGLPAAGIGVVYDDGLDDVGEVEGEGEDLAGDGTTPGHLRLTSRPVTLGLSTRAPSTSDEDPFGDESYADLMHQLRIVCSLPPNRTGSRLLRWRRHGEIAWRLWVQPGPGKPLTVPGDEARIVYNNADLVVRATAPNPVIVSDELHTVTFSAGETKSIENLGSLTAVFPWAWSLSAPGAVTLEHLDFDEYVRFPAGPVTVSTDGEIVAPGTYGLAYGPAGSIGPRMPLLRPGVNHIRASAACTFSWRDTR